MNRAALFILLLILPIFGSDEWKAFFPEKHRALIMVKGSYCKDRSTEEVIPFWALGGEYRFRAHDFRDPEKGYIQLVTPASLYHFPTKDAVVAEIRLRPDIGPPAARWIPHGMVDIGCSWFSRDWLTGRDSALNALTIGGWFMIPLKLPDDGIFRVNGATSIAGDKLIRFSCYLHWFFTDHIGFTIHGDNFSTKRDGLKYHYGSMNLGILVRI